VVLVFGGILGLLLICGIAAVVVSSSGDGQRTAEKPIGADEDLYAHAARAAGQDDIDKGESNAPAKEAGNTKAQGSVADAKSREVDTYYIVDNKPPVLDKETIAKFLTAYQKTPFADRVKYVTEPRVRKG
jgi:hypothetical protein